MHLFQNSTSFLQTHATSKIDTKSNFQELLKTSQQVRAKVLQVFLKRRLAKDGRHCQKSYVYKGQLYYGCNNKQDPEGKDTGQEWCFVEESGNPSNWQYCDPVLDFDNVRQFTYQKLEERVIEMRKIVDQLYLTINEVNKVQSAYNQIVKIQQAIDPKMNNLQQMILKLSSDYGQLEKMRNQWEDFEQKIKVLTKEITQLKKANHDDNPSNCEGLLGYEEEKEGDGLRGQYFDNEAFMGQPKEQQDQLIDFDWSGDSPSQDINSDNFSGVWVAFLKIPVTGYYEFRSESDDGHEMSLNDQIIISHNMGNIGKNNQQQGGSYLRLADFQFIGAEQLARGGRSESLQLMAGTKYKIQLRCYHSIHKKFLENQPSYFKLFWKSQYFQEELIGQQFYYISNKAPPLKIYGYTSKLVELSSLANFINAFKDSDTYKLADVPQQYEGMSLLRFETDMYESQINLVATAPVTIYIGTNMLQPSPLDQTWVETQDVFSLLKINKINKKVMSKAANIKARTSDPIKLYKKNFLPGPIEINLLNTQNKKPGEQSAKRIVMFYNLNVYAASQLSCGGEEQLVSLASGSAFESCKESSKLNDNFGCRFAFVNKMIDGEFNIWASNQEGVGSYIELLLKEEYQITKIQYKNRDFQGERNKELILIFSNGYSQQVTLKNQDEPQLLRFEPQIAKSIKFYVKSVYGTYNNGGAINVYGLACKAADGKPQTKVEQKPTSTDQIDKDQILKLTCRDTLTNNQDIQSKNYKTGEKFIVQCNDPCAKPDQKEQIFGNLIYSEDSSICKAATHMGVLSSAAPTPFTVEIQRGQNQYESSFRNGILSTFKASTESTKSMTFIKILDDFTRQMEAIQVGMKVDIFDQKLKKWEEGQIEKLDRRSQKELYLTVSLNGYGPEFYQRVQWGQTDLVDYCGQQLKQRVCDAKSKKPKIQTKDQVEVQICFTPKKQCPDGFMVDNGFPLSNKGQYEYGWSRDISSLARTRNEYDSELFDNLILFPADLRSKWCKNNDPKVPCEPAFWSIKVPKGKYEVQLTVGDPIYSSAYSISVNGKQFFNNEILRKKQFETRKKRIIVQDDYIKIQSICNPTDQDCKNVWSRMNSVKITSIPKNVQEPTNKDSTTFSLGCGNAFISGRCSDGTNPLNCVYDNPLDPNLKNCAGFMHLVKISYKYECKNQQGKFKCILDKYETADACRQSCPGKCKGDFCSIEKLKLLN